jgi:hypothetical protein
MYRKLAKVALPMVVLAVIAAITVGAAGPCDLLSLIFG